MPGRSSNAPVLDDEDLARRIQALRRQQAERLVVTNKRRFIPGGSVQFAARAGSDFVAAIFVALAIGPTIDGLCGTWPWATVTVIPLSVTAGVIVSYRLARSMAESGAEGGAEGGSAGGRAGNGGRMGTGKMGTVSETRRAHGQYIDKL